MKPQTEPSYSQKLRDVMEEIKPILKKHDIAAFVLLHEPGFTEYLNHITPSWSCAKVTSGDDEVGHYEGLVISLNAEEYPDVETAQKVANNTYNMIADLTETLCTHAAMYSECREALKERWGAIDEPVHTPSPMIKN